MTTRIEQFCHNCKILEECEKLYDPHPDGCPAYKKIAELFDFLEKWS